jgi:hypothetical protein
MYAAGLLGGHAAIGLQAVSCNIRRYRPDRTIERCGRPLERGVVACNQCEPDERGVDNFVDFQGGDVEFMSSRVHYERFLRAHSKLWAHTVDKPANILVRPAIEEVLAADGAVEVAAEEAVYGPPLDPRGLDWLRCWKVGCSGTGPLAPCMTCNESYCIKTSNTEEALADESDKGCWGEMKGARCSDIYPMGFTCPTCTSQNKGNLLAGAWVFPETTRAWKHRVEKEELELHAIAQKVVDDKETDGEHRLGTSKSGRTPVKPEFPFTDRGMFAFDQTGTGATLLWALTCKVTPYDGDSAQKENFDAQCNTKTGTSFKQLPKEQGSFYASMENAVIWWTQTSQRIDLHEHNCVMAADIAYNVKTMIAHGRLLGSKHPWKRVHAYMRYFQLACRRDAGPTRRVWPEDKFCKDVWHDMLEEETRRDKAEMEAMRVQLRDAVAESKAAAAKANTTPNGGKKRSGGDGNGNGNGNGNKGGDGTTPGKGTPTAGARVANDGKQGWVPITERTCRNCGKTGHIATACPADKTSPDTPALPPKKRGKQNDGTTDGGDGQ